MSSVPDDCVEMSSSEEERTEDNTGGTQRGLFSSSSRSNQPARRRELTEPTDFWTHAEDHILLKAVKMFRGPNVLSEVSQLFGTGKTIRQLQARYRTLKYWMAMHPRALLCFAPRPGPQETVDLTKEERVAGSRRRQVHDQVHEPYDPVMDRPVRSAANAEVIEISDEETIPDPWVPVRGPRVPVRGPRVPVRGPRVPVRGPRVPVRGPRVPVRGPRVPVRGPRVPVRGPRVPVRGPRVPVRGPRVPVRGPRVPVPAPVRNPVVGSSAANPQNIEIIDLTKEKRVAGSRRQVHVPVKARGRSTANTEQKQLGDMEGEMKEIQMELEQIRRNRADSVPKKHGPVRFAEPDEIKDSTVYSASIHMVDAKTVDNEDVESSRLREELIRAKNYADEERSQRLKYEGKLKDLELKIKVIAGSNIDLKESQKLSEEIASLKTQIRDVREEKEELKLNLEETTVQVQEYRVKYLQAQQQADELKRQLDVMEFDSKHSSDQIQIELQKMKMQFQEKLLELAPLPDLLKGAQIQLQEAQQLQKLAEDNSEEISMELHRVKEKLVASVNSLNHEKAENKKLMDENAAQICALDEKQREIDAKCKEIDDNKCLILRLEEKRSQDEARQQEKMAEYSNLARNLEDLREESVRTLSRTKERFESTRHYLQSQIAGLERQMIACRAQCRAYQKERDDIRQRMQLQILTLRENFGLVETRLRGLQGQVTFLKHCYVGVLPGEVEDLVTPE